VSRGRASIVSGKEGGKEKVRLEESIGRSRKPRKSAKGGEISVRR